MTHPRFVTLFVAALVMFGLGSAWAFVVTDPATTARNAVTAVLKSQIVDTIVQQHHRLRGMAGRLSAHTSLDKYAAQGPPRACHYERAMILGALGDTDEALAELDSSIRANEPAARWLLADETLRPLRRDPRMAQLARKLGLRG